MRIITLIFYFSLLTACASKQDKLLTQFELKVEQYETLAREDAQNNAPQLDTIYNEIDAIMNELLSATLTEAETVRASQLSLRLEVAILGSTQTNEPTIEIDLNQMLQGIEAENAEK